MRFLAAIVVFLVFGVVVSATKMRFDAFNIWGCPKDDPSVSQKQSYDCDPHKRQTQGTSSQFCMCEADLDRLMETGDHYIAYNSNSQYYLDKIAASTNKLAWMADGFSNFFIQGKSGADYADYLWSQANTLFAERNNGVIPTYWILNELSFKRWFGSKKAPYSKTYHKYAIDVVKRIHETHPEIRPIVCSPSLQVKPKTFPQDWKALAQYAYVGVEAYVNSSYVKTHKLSVNALYKAYTKGIKSYVAAGVPRYKMIVFEEFATTPSGTFYGSGGLNPKQWATTIANRNKAIKLLKVAGFASYGWSSILSDTPDTRKAYYDAYSATAQYLP